MIGMTGYFVHTKRHFAGLPLERYRLERKYDIYKIPAYLHVKLFGKMDWRFSNTHNDFGLHSCKLWHLYNSVSFGPTPWITTYETVLPRWRKVSRKRIEAGMRRLADDSCKRIICMSHSGHRIQKHYLESFPAYKDAILAKMCVLHPGQERMIEDYSEKTLDPNHLVMTMVGSKFYLKGGVEVLKAFVRLVDEGYPLKLNIVSILDYDDHVSGADASVHEWAKGVIAKYSTHITYHYRLPNPEVLALFKASHVGLLPTYADTYGYSVLEAMGCGCAIMATGIRALPEIVPEKAGWLIDVPVDDRGFAQLHNEADRLRYSEIVEEGLYHYFKEAVENLSLTRRKGLEALEWLKYQHDREQKALITDAMYDEALGGGAPSGARLRVREEDSYLELAKDGVVIAR